MTGTEDLLSKIAEHVRAIMRLLGIDLTNPDIAETPQRVAQMLLELTSGLREKPPEVKFFKIPENALNNLIIVRNIEIDSLCEHHLLPIIGKATIVYKPRTNSVPGLSKVIRLVQWFARRPILQERFTQELAELLLDKINAKFVYCHVKAIHLCSFMRGVKSRLTVLETEAVAGEIDVELNMLREVARDYDRVRQPLY